MISSVPGLLFMWLFLHMYWTDSPASSLHLSSLEHTGRVWSSNMRVAPLASVSWCLYKVRSYQTAILKQKKIIYLLIHLATDIFKLETWKKMFKTDFSLLGRKVWRVKRQSVGRQKDSDGECVATRDPHESSTTVFSTLTPVWSQRRTESKTSPSPSPQAYV